MITVYGVRAPGNLFYGPEDNQRTDGSKPSPSNALDTEAEKLMPAAQYAALKEANTYMNKVINLPADGSPAELYFTAKEAVGHFVKAAYNNFIVAWDRSKWEKVGGKWRVQ